MKILVLNCGSSSVKYKLIDSESKDVLAEGGVEKSVLKVHSSSTSVQTAQRVCSKLTCQSTTQQ